jgi:NTP pyrophosphatase (non-canonical NTP hydrolase)
MPVLKDNPSLIDFQNYVEELEEERGFIQQTVLEKCLLLGEEIGELFKAIRKNEHIKIDPKSKIYSIHEELADIVIMVCSIANHLHVNLETAFRNKEELNKSRNWG